MRGKTLDFDLELELDRKGAVGLLAALVMFSLPTRLGSESVTLNTTFPAPDGIYGELRSTRSSYFAYGSGAVGIGTTTPGAGLKLDVNGNASANGNLAVAGAISTDGVLQVGRFASPPIGLCVNGSMIYNTTLNTFMICASQVWRPFPGLQSQWAASCPAGWINTLEQDCDGGADGHLLEEDSCGGGSTQYLCLRLN